MDTTHYIIRFYVSRKIKMKYINCKKYDKTFLGYKTTKLKIIVSFRYYYYIYIKSFSTLIPNFKKVDICKF